MAAVAKWLTHRIVAPTFGGSIPLSRPIFIYLSLSIDSVKALILRFFYLAFFVKYA